MINFKKFFNTYWDLEKSERVISLFGKRFRFHKKHSFSSIYIELDNVNSKINALRYLLDNYLDIRACKPATGQLRDIQLECIKMLDIVKTICEENNLNYWLDAGTLLGAVRHNGFVPWDDDIDLCMCRKDYDVMSKLITKYFDKSCYYIRKKCDTANNFQIRVVNIHNYAALDIFPMDSYFKNNLTETEKTSITENIKKAREKFDKKYPKKEMYYDVDLMKKELKNFKNTYIMQKHNSKNNGALYYAIDFPYEAANNLIYNYDEVFPLTKIMFEGNYYNAPNQTDTYLKNIYNDYNKFPEYICAANPLYYEQQKKSLQVH